LVRGRARRSSAKTTATRHADSLPLRPQPKTRAKFRVTMPLSGFLIVPPDRASGYHCAFLTAKNYIDQVFCGQDRLNVDQLHWLVAAGTYRRCYLEIDLNHEPPPDPRR
jgi:hypothetical protein